jgi:hypothetical protein
VPAWSRAPKIGNGRAIRGIWRPADVAPGCGTKLFAAWRGEWGGDDAAGAYRRYVEAGLTDPPHSPFRETFGGWVLGSRDFVERLRALAGPLASDPPLREARQLAGLEPGVILATVTEYYGLESGAYPAA